MLNIAIWFGSGAILGWLSVLSQKWTVSRLNAGSSPLITVFFLLGTGIRWLATAALLFFSIKVSLPACLAAVAGLILVRWPALVYYTRRLV